MTNPSTEPNNKAGAVERISNLGLQVPPEHYRVFVQALSRLCSTELAMSTFAALFDGVPPYETLLHHRGKHTYIYEDDHPIRNHRDLCDGAWDRMLEFKASFDPAVLPFDSHLIDEYKQADVGSRAFKMRLLELMANAVHQLGVYIWKHVDPIHPDMEIHDWKPYSDSKPPYSTLFNVAWYISDEQYPDGESDTVGYWVEDQILGGITLFDRGESGFECKDIYWHSARDDATRRICRLRDDQIVSMLRFYVAPEAVPCPFPILADMSNRHRFDLYDAIVDHNIFRDRWERKIPKSRPRPPDVLDDFDYPEILAHRDVVAAVLHDPETPLPAVEERRAWSTAYYNRKEKMVPQWEEIHGKPLDQATLWESQVFWGHVYDDTPLTPKPEDQTERDDES